MSETEGEKRAFNAGYVLACCNLQNLHDEPTIAADVLREIGISRSQVRDMGLSEYDMSALREILKSTSNHPLAGK